MKKCDKVRALRSCSGDVHVARVHVIALVVDAVVGLMLGLIARVVVSFCRRVSVANFLYLEVYSLHPPSVTVNCVGCYRIVTVIFAPN